MAHNRRTISKIEFNKRVRDIVSRDSNRLRQTFQKFDKEYDRRLAEIHNMQEKVRHSMRNLTQEKIKARQGKEFGNWNRGMSKESETERDKSFPEERKAESMSDSKVVSADERMKHNNKASLPGIHFNRSDHLEVPNGGQARIRRYSLPHRPTFTAGSPKESRALPMHASNPKTNISSSLPNEAFVRSGSPRESSLSGSPKQSLHGVTLQYLEFNARNRKSDYRLSVSDLPIKTSRSDPLSTVRMKLSPQMDRKANIIVSKDETAGEDHDINSKPDKDEISAQESCEKEECSENTDGSHSNLQHQQATDRSFDNAMEPEPEKEHAYDANHVKPKTVLKRTRSSSLPCDPDLMKNLQLRDNHRAAGLTRPSRSARHAGGTSRESSPGFLLQTGTKSTSNSFEELRRCRYLRTSNDET